MNDEELYLYIKKNFTVEQGQGCLFLISLEPNLKIDISYHTNRDDMLSYLHAIHTDQICASLEYYAQDFIYNFSGRDFVQQEDMLKHKMLKRYGIGKPPKDPPTIEQIRKDMEDLIEFLTKPQTSESDPDVIH